MARNDIGYDFEDFGMQAGDLAQKYEDVDGEGEHPVYGLVPFQVYAAMPTRDVKLSYWDWVAHQIAKDDDAIEGAPEPSNPAERLSEQQVEDLELVTIESIDQFGQMVAHWHGAKVAKLRHFLAMPEGQEVTTTVGDKTETVELTGEAYKGFRAGVLTALLQFQELPFAMSVSDEPDPAKH